MSSATEEKKLYILRGISGSGKSTLAKKIQEEEGCSQANIVFSTDDFFVNKTTGKYEFDGSKIGRAHQWNQGRVKKAMSEGQQLIIVDNTNTQCWEAKPYVLMAIEHKYQVHVREPDTPWAKDAQELARRNLHNVPLEAIQRMLSRWDNDFSVEAILKSKEPSFKRKPPVRKSMTPQQK